MHTYELANNKSVNDLISVARESQEPFIISDGGAECLVAMHPAVFERVLFGTAVLNCSERLAMHL